MRSVRTSVVRGLVAAGTTIVLASGLGAGVASASTIESSLVGPKWAYGQAFDCDLKQNRDLWYCRNA
ncbi:MAG TPA: hypothetical protein H9870_11435 [Candidatus Corynebacterium avicola]|uniref:Uncharacterized protein n=1 Tax=Candidatus Corynebacterium avicola TaxID=2838527 RepID=A0A9D1RR67_9CORY|nr:hypothetical protein [Candidatus Corynebacterium avicola]